jgi:hypothetical protein
MLPVEPHGGSSPSSLSASGSTMPDLSGGAGECGEPCAARQRVGTLWLAVPGEEHMAGVLVGNLRSVGSRHAILEALNGPWHRTALQAFMLIVLAHLVEHVAQSIQIFVLHWPRPAARGALGLLFPWLVSSEVLHYAYALVMLVGLIVLLPGFRGRSRLWWSLAVWIQVWHHFEHALLFGQAMVQANLFGSPVPVSVAQLVVPRVELHLFYNAIVFVPMVVAMYFHAWPPASELRGGALPGPRCRCARRAALATG